VVNSNTHLEVPDLIADVDEQLPHTVVVIEGVDTQPTWGQLAAAPCRLPRRDLVSQLSAECVARALVHWDPAPRRAGCI